MIRWQKTEWQAIAESHKAEVQTWTLPFRERRKRQASHPVDDFLFVYYQYSPAKLEQWHPGVGHFLDGATDALFANAPYHLTTEGAFLDPTNLGAKERRRMEWIANLLEQTSKRKGNFSCLGLHEWAMVYKGKQVRHEKSTPLRLTQDKIDQVVDSRPITCTHFDAFRFFAEEATPLNRIQPTMESRPELGTTRLHPCEYGSL